MKALPRSFYRRDARVVAPELLGKVLVCRELPGAGAAGPMTAGRGAAVADLGAWGSMAAGGMVAGRIVEVEAYCGSDDPGSHAFGGPTPRTTVMFGPPGRLYVYRSYGMHWCANAVCGPEGVAQAVLVRALAPLSGLNAMRQGRARGQRHAVTDRDLCRGPGRLCQALGITGDHNGADLVLGGRGVAVMDDQVAPPERPGVSVRIGLTKGAEHPWRFFVAGDRHVSGPRPASEAWSEG